MNTLRGENRSDWTSWPLEREVVVTRVIAVSREIVFRAWTDPAHIVHWFGPDGMEIKTHEIEIRAGGIWRFDMVTPDGHRFSNRMEFLRVDPPLLIEANHGTDTENDPDCFRLLVTFDEQDNGKTVVTLRQMHPTPERRDIVIGFGAVEFGNQTLGKLADYIAANPKLSAVGS